MKKIYSKFTVERKPQFQLETSILVDQGIKSVVKTPLCEDAEAHISNMHENYKKFSNNKLYQLAPCKMEGKKVVFEYAEGTSFCSKILECVVKRDKPRFVESMLEYRKLAEFSIEGREKSFSLSPEFEEVFGVYDNLAGAKAGKHLNIDFTFDNIMISEDGTKTVIDYEWYFDFVLPINFVIYRAVHGFFVKYSQVLYGFSSEEEICNIFGISKDETVTYQTMDRRFVEYVYGKEEGYNQFLEHYRKEIIEVKDLIRKDSDIYQLFINMGEGYSIEHSITQPFQINKKMQTINVNLEQYDSIQELRFDPMDGSCIIEFNGIKAVLADGSEVELHEKANNSEFCQDNLYLFKTEDPQFIYDTEGLKIKEVVIEFRVVDKQLSGAIELCLSAKREIEVQYSEKLMDCMRTIDKLQARIANIEKEKNLLLVNKQGLEQRLNVLANDYHMLQYQTKKR